MHPDKHKTLLCVAPADEEPFITFQLIDRAGTTGTEWLPWPERRVLYPIEEFVADALMIRGVTTRHDDPLAYYKRYGITHLCLLPSDEATGAWFWFGEEKFPLAMILYWCAEAGHYRLMYDERTAEIVCKWIESMQPEWSDNNEGLGLQKAYTTH